MQRLWAAAAALILLAVPSLAQEVRLTPDMLNMALDIRGKTVVIERIQNQDNKLTNGFAKTSRACPPFCIHAMEAAPGIETVGELELIDYLSDYVAQGKGLLIDSRLPDFYSKGTIPGAVNLPFSTVDEGNPYRDEILKALGATPAGGSWEFDTALDLLAFCNGPWCDQSPRMLKNLLAIGYPAEKLRYYRGGMQNWLMLGLSVEVP